MIDSLKCALLSMSLAFGWWPVQMAHAWAQAAPGSVLDWLLLLATAIALAAGWFALATYVLAARDLWKRRSQWQAGFAALLASFVLYGYKDFP